MGPRACPLAKPDPFRRSRSQSLARSPSLSRHTPSGIVSKRGHKRVPISSSCWPTLSRARTTPHAASFLHLVVPLYYPSSAHQSHERAHSTGYSSASASWRTRRIFQREINLMISGLLLDLDYFMPDKRVSDVHRDKSTRNESVLS